MENDRPDREQREQEEQLDERGMPGGGVGRRETPGHTGVYPMSEAEDASPDAPLQGEMSWGQGDRGAEGYNDSGDSELARMPENTNGAENIEE